MVCYPIAALLLGKEATLFGFISAFILSSFGGALIAFVCIKIFFKRKVLLLDKNL
ncbi:energy coupling factor transporter S component ThiW [Bacillus sp. MUM 116]|uniref:energy coupling factor transporter S component ThiW n=1 Tax=Bacillus sp. MUM 116 TaxID=1678002 RepID=UPI00114D4178|nr:hypothetical protein [Bacillus sp. MUM 116]